MSTDILRQANAIVYFRMLRSVGHFRPVAGSLSDEVIFLSGQLELGTRRNRLLHAALGILYLALGMFAATSVAIAIVALTGQEYGRVTMSLGVGGASLLLVSVGMLIWETRLSGKSISRETAYLLRRHRVG